MRPKSDRNSGCQHRETFDEVQKHVHQESVPVRSSLIQESPIQAHPTKANSQVEIVTAGEMCPREDSDNLWVEFLEVSSCRLWSLNEGRPHPRKAKPAEAAVYWIWRSQ